MLFPSKFRRAAVLIAFGFLAMIPFALVFAASQSGEVNQENIADPWSNAQALQPADFARELADTKGKKPPTIIYVGFRTLFEGGHIPGAMFYGTASREPGLSEFKKWVAALPRSTNLVIYCGCCPFNHCPNIRPAYTVLHEMGFTNVRVLVLPTSFAADWVEKGYLIQKGP